MSTNLTLPTLGDGIASATVVEVFVKPGDAVVVDQPLMSLETDKAQFELPSTMAGTIERVLVAVGAEIAVGQAVAVMTGGADAVAAPAVTASPPPTPPSPPPTVAPRATAAVPVSGDAIAAAPSVRRLARERGVTLDAVAAFAQSTRITTADVEAYLRSRQTAAPPPGTVPSAGMLLSPLPLPDFAQWGPITTEPMSKIRRKTAENMARAWVEIPTVTHHDEADITALEALRKRHAPRVKEAGGSLTWTAILLKVLAGALARFPKLNASVDMAAQRIVFKQYVHIGVAVDTERGLLVPVIRDVDRKSIIELARDLTTVSEAARSRNIKPDMMQGASFTITNLGGIGGVAFSPIVNPPQVAILGIARASLRPVWRGAAFEPRLVMPLAVSYDHRIIDGAEAARFLRWVCETLEAPFALDVEVP